MNLGEAMTEFRALAGHVLSGAPYTDEEFYRYVELGAEILDEPGGAELMGVELGKKKKKGFFKKITKKLRKVVKPIAKIVKKAAKVVMPILKTVVSAALSKGGGAGSAKQETAEYIEEDPNAGMAMAAFTTGAQALTDAGIQMPPDIAAAAAFAQQGLQQSPSGQQMIDQANAPLEAAGYEPPEETPVMTYVVIGGAALAAILGVGAVAMGVLMSDDGGRKRSR